MIQFYYYPSTNPNKVALFLEEAGLDYEMVPVEIRLGAQFSPEFLTINPNAKAPALVDGDAKVFDSNAILLYLGEKTGRFMSDGTPAGHAQLLSWLMLVATGIGPYSGQAVYFQHFAPERTEYALTRYMYEARRHWRLIDAQLEKGSYMVGDRYSIVDMAVWGWARALPRVIGENAWDEFPNVKRFVDMVSARPAAQRVAELADRHKFKTEMDESAVPHMFGYLKTATP